jgi:aspartyl-tRNA(Asn)/glutamyl-tRNA(Gln) amidotransferase subunit A
MSRVPDNPFSGLSIAQYGAALREGKRTALATTDALLSRIQALNPKLGAYTFVAEARARADARHIDQLLRARTDLGPLMGVPVAVKDLYFVEGMPLTAGSQLDVSGIVRAEGPVITALKRGGAIIVGKTWTSEFALGGINFKQRVPWNPCDPDVHRTPGGSSGGSAVAMAAGLCALALGTDTGGSVRMPAALCGVFGHKFSARALSIEGIFPLSPTLDSPGTFTSTARDAVAAWQALNGVAVPEMPPMRGLKLGVPSPVFNDDLDHDVARAFEHAQKRLTDCGAVVEPLDVPEVREFEATFSRVVPHELLDILGRERVRENIAVFDDVTQARFSAALDTPAQDTTRLHAELKDLRHRVADRMEGYDAWIAPTVPLVPGPLHECATLHAALAWNRRALRNTRPGNIFDQCGVSLPLPGTGLPVGMQILCPALEDARLLAIACAVEAAISAPE